MKTSETDYGKFFPLESGGFPEEYPYKEPFHIHIKNMAKYLRYINHPEDIEDEFMDEIEKYLKDGFVNFAEHCMKKYNDIHTKRLEDLEDGCL